MNTGCHHGVPMADYLALPAFSASLVRATVDRCPRAAWFESWLNPARPDDFSDASDAGTIAHEILLEGSMDCVAVIDPQDHPAEKTGNIPVGWTNKSIRAARDAARAAGLIPVLPEDMVVIGGMVESARAFIDGLRNTEPAIWAAFQPDGGDSEVTMLWEEDSTLCRMRPDRISRDRAVIVDAKFTTRTAEPETWGRSQLVSMGYYVSASFYRRGVRRLFSVEPDYVFLVIEDAPPYLCSLVGIDPAGLALGDRKIEAGLAMWRQCVAANDWPAYPNRVVYHELPVYESARWEEREGNDAHGIPYDLSKLFPKREAAA